MLQRDYLMQMIVQFIQAIFQSRELALKKRDPEAAADLIEAAIEQAIDMDGAALLSLAPESMASVLQISGVEPKLVGYIGHSLLQEAEYLRMSGNEELAKLREEQGIALFNAYGLCEDDIEFPEQDESGQEVLEPRDQE
jgi:hypothetical protein